MDKRKYCYTSRTAIPRVSFLQVYEPGLVLEQIVLGYNVTLKQFFFDILMMRGLNIERLGLKLLKVQGSGPEKLECVYDVTCRNIAIYVIADVLYVITKIILWY